MQAAGASWITSICSRSTPSCVSASWASASVGTITRTARCTASCLSRGRTPVRSSSLRRFSAVRSCSVTTIGHGLCSSAPFIHGEWNTSARPGWGVSTISSSACAVSRSASSRQRV